MNFAARVAVRLAPSAARRLHAPSASSTPAVALHRSGRPHAICPESPPAAAPNAAVAATAAAAAALAASLALAPSALAESPSHGPKPAPPPPVKAHAPRAVDTPLDWHQLIAALRTARATAPAGFRAARRAPALGRSAWSHELHFGLAPSADIHSILATFASSFAGDGEVTLRVDDSGTRRRTVLSRDGDFELAVSVPRVSPFDGSVAVEILREADARFSVQEVDAVLRAYSLSTGADEVAEPRTPRHLLDGKQSVDRGPPTTAEQGRTRGNRQPQEVHRYGLPQDPNGSAVVYDGESELDDEIDPEIARQRARLKLQELGVDVVEKEDGLAWDALAGYAEVKQRIEDTLTLPLRHPEVYDRIVRGTRQRVECNVPKAVLYEGPPGCGKTLSARILASSIGVPFVHVRVETILSKFYGETTRKLAEILEAANSLGKCIVFLDECDSVGLRRSGTSEVHEVTRRTLSVLLRFIDGMDGAKDAIILAATNHKEDLDAALMSRFDVVVSFPLPDFETRIAVLGQYAKQLKQEDIRQVAELTWGFSGRELVDICEEAERIRAGIIVRQKEKGEQPEEENDLPVLKEYVEAIERKSRHVVGRWDQRFGAAHHHVSSDRLPVPAPGGESNVPPAVAAA